jgi:hypothetical protein
MDIIDALTAEETFMNATRTCMQWYLACSILRVNKSLAVPDAIIRRGLGIDRALVKNHFKKDSDYLDQVGRNCNRPIL